MMMIRVQVPSGMTEAVVGVARDHRGVAEVVVVSEASLEPPGDLIELQVARESVEQLLEGFDALGVRDAGSVALFTPDAVLGTRADEAVAEAPGEGSDAVIWEELKQRTGSDSRLTWQFLVFLVAATNLAGIGIVTDSTIAIVGAMVVGPEFGPLAAVAVALVERRWVLARQAALALLVGFPAAMLTVAAAAAVSVPLRLFDPAIVAAPDSAVEFIYKPGPYSFIVAVIAGAVGMVSLVGNKSSALVGVFISVTTVPAAGYVAVALVLGQPEKALGSALQLALNLTGIVVAAVVVLVVYRTLTPEMPPQALARLRDRTHWSAGRRRRR
ncbi:DUF389 domain-containing protein [Sinomonas sp. R1AF57]|uniref:DUF389 domain-containing protein n=1 Tax=Sinomonas sp. R1AF57 TaxID=2020377 RepID=UPI000B614FA3|nr:DUF389 domain-containing protein [Sinomonas sp. R1AF57]ASN52542.1 hypothetical protein CGQ25_11035 [Sinomonas sp. R1AF57]